MSSIHHSTKRSLVPAIRMLKALDPFTTFIKNKPHTAVSLLVSDLLSIMHLTHHHFQRSVQQAAIALVRVLHAPSLQVVKGSLCQYSDHDLRSLPDIHTSPEEFFCR